MLSSNPIFREELRELWDFEKDFTSVSDFCSEYNISESYFYKNIGNQKGSLKESKVYKEDIKLIPRRELTKEEEEEIIKLYKEGVNEEEIKEKYNLNLGQVFDILEPVWEKNQILKNLTSSNNIYNKSILQMVKQGYTLKKISFYFSVRIGTLNDILEKRK